MQPLGLVVAVISAVVLLPSSVAAQEGCILGDRGRNDVFVQNLPGVGRITYIGGPHFVCDRGVQIFADSAVAYGDRGMSHLMGDVRYLEDGRELQAQEARYFSNEGRLQAQGDVLVVDAAQGSRIEDGDLVYLLATEFREMSEMTVTTEADGTRPQAVLTPPRDSVRAGTPDDSLAVGDTLAMAGDTAATPPDTLPAAPDTAGTGRRAPEPYTVVADRIFLRGSGYFAASRDVEIVRDSLFAYADSAEYDQGAGALVLEGGARVEGTSYELTGRTITMTEPGGAESNVRALREARLTGEDLLLTSAQILVVLRDGDLHRLVATPLVRQRPAARSGPRPQPSPRPEEAEEAPDSADLERPEALVQDFVLTADSLEVDAPGERIQRVFAAGSARSVSTARDSLNAEVLPETARSDWLEGDTVVIRFPGSPPVPPLRVPDPDSLVADTLIDETAVVAADTVAPGDTMVSGDTIVAGDTIVRGDTIAPADTVAPGGAVASVDTVPGDRDLEPGVLVPEATGDDPDETEPEEIIARGRARSLYRLPPNDSTFRPGTDAPAVHYVVGDEIRIRLDSGEVDEMRVTGQTRGVHLEPLKRRADSTGVADSLAVPPDTGAATVDTLSAQPDTGVVSMEQPTAPGSAPPPPPSGPPRDRSNVSQQAEGHAHLPKDPSWIHR